MFNIILLSISIFVSCSPKPDTTGSWINPEKLSDVGIFTESIPKREVRWKSPPHVRICDFSPVDVERVHAAIKWWQDRGYMFAGVSNGGIWGGCKHGKISGSITISLSGQDFKFSEHLGETRVYKTTSGMILQANIEIPEGSGEKDRILEHEIGHAIGWGHYKKRGHIMHPIYNMGGLDDAYVHHDF
tara:strand:+ start:6188 stop:6748 length:561 start_codon:yes stop_codon:yes gene_type:complete